MSTPMECPKCKINLCDGEISEADKDFYAKGLTHYSRVISVYDPIKDRHMYWKCPDCGYVWI